MVDFKKLENYISIIEKGEIPLEKSFNEFVVEFYKISKIVPLSKYLKSINRTSKTPKIMNAKKAGEVIFFSEKDDEIKTLLKRNGYKEIPQMDYTSIMLLRKVDLFMNWKKLISYFDGKGTIQEINNSLKPKLLPGEVEKLESYVKEELKLTDQEYNWFLNKFSKIILQKELDKSLRKLVNQ
ncbi:MAG: hypothetical protein ACRC0S_03660 [Fusobacteriaceae bacterium]